MEGGDKGGSKNTRTEVYAEEIEGGWGVGLLWSFIRENVGVWRGGGTE